MLACLALDLPSLVVALGNRGGEIAVSWDHDESDVGLRGAGDHVLDEVAVPRRVDDGIVPLLREELLPETEWMGYYLNGV